ncbi:MAG: GerMN domain-containing protein [Synergistaceae bacterium]|jgi:hypothetical protein|nr:GerMN domain-containing protein [Synergistaceae bacterium]
MARRGSGDFYEKRWDDSMEKEFEEKVGRRRSSDVRGRQRNEERAKAPFLLRLLAWCGVILFCFVIGYAGTAYVLHLLDTQVLLKADGGSQAGSRRELEASLGSDGGDARLDMQKAAFSLFYPKNGSLTEEKTEIIASTNEDNIGEVVLKLLELSGMFGKEVRVAHVFRNADTVYLDFAGPFTAMLSSAGAQASTLFITGIVRTMRDGFSPIAKVRFLVDSKVVTAGAPVDLTAAWQLSR